MAAKPMPRIRAGVSGSTLAPPGGDAKKHISISNKCLNEDKATVSSSYDNMNYLAEKNTVAFGNHNFAGSNSTETLEKMTTNHDESDKNIFGIMSKDLEKNEIKMEKKLEVNNDSKEELERLKQLMMLQTSLISRQQDLLKLRDKEILKLKTTNQALNSRMDRMGRRISLSRRTSHDPINVILETTEQINIEKKTFNDLEMTSDLVSSIKEGQKVANPGSKPAYLSQNTEMCSTPISKPPKKRKKSKHDAAEKNNDSAKNITLFSPIKSPSGQNHIPVPLSFIERCQNELISSFTNPLLTKDGTTDPNVGLKVCERCPHCTVMAAEITQLIMLANNSDLNASSNESGKVDLSEDLQTVEGQPQAEAKPDKEGPTERSLLRTPHPYHRQHLFHETDNFPALVGWNDVKNSDKMLIPTWRLNEIEPCDPTIPSTAKIEDTSDETYIKRHTKFEMNEKRRKRWDIQRIREFRYNEKLRQKEFRCNEKLRQNLPSKERSDTGVLESFLPSLFDIDILEVNDEVPVNFFGYPLPNFKQSEFKFSINHNSLKKS